MSADFHIIIPARYQSSRLPGKLLMDIHGMTVLERVYRQACLAKPQSVCIGTDSELIASHAKTFGAQVVMTSSRHQSGTDRVAEVAAKVGYQPDDILVNVQGDEPFIDPQLIQQAAQSLLNTKASMATLCWPIDSLELLHNPNVVKVVRSKNNQALYFSRSPIPANREEPSSYANTFRHIGLYAYRAAFLLDFVSWPVCELEEQEQLEQLRALWAGVAIQVEEACLKPLQDINTLEDLLKARSG